MYADVGAEIRTMQQKKEKKKTSRDDFIVFFLWPQLLLPSSSQQTRKTRLDEHGSQEEQARGGRGRGETERPSSHQTSQTEEEEGWLKEKMRSP